jgi:hypothetical protein
MYHGAACTDRLHLKNASQSVFFFANFPPATVGSGGGYEMNNDGRSIKNPSART